MTEVKRWEWRGPDATLKKLRELTKDFASQLKSARSEERSVKIELGEGVRACARKSNGSRFTQPTGYEVLTIEIGPYSEAKLDAELGDAARAVPAVSYKELDDACRRAGIEWGHDHVGTLQLLPAPDRLVPVLDDEGEPN
jgi:hypothetical protein